MNSIHHNFNSSQTARNAVVAASFFEIAGGSSDAKIVKDRQQASLFKVNSMIAKLAFAGGYSPGRALGRLHLLEGLIEPIGCGSSVIAFANPKTNRVVKVDYHTVAEPAYISERLEMHCDQSDTHNEFLGDLALNQEVVVDTVPFRDNGGLKCIRIHQDLLPADSSAIPFSDKALRLMLAGSQDPELTLRTIELFVAGSFEMHWQAEMVPDLFGQDNIRLNEDGSVVLLDQGGLSPRHGVDIADERYQTTLRRIDMLENLLLTS